MQNLQMRLRRPPSEPGDFELQAVPAPQLTHGSFLARALWLALDPFGYDSAGADAAKIGDLVPAHGVAKVIDSRHEVFDVGSLVVLECGLQQLCVSDGSQARLLHPGQTPHSSALGVLGAPGMAAYFGLLELAHLRPGETVLVSAAAGAAGATAGQLAMLKGARAIGLAGSREQCDWVTRHARFQACINPAMENLGARLAQLAPRGVDVFFDNVGGGLLEAVIANGALAPRARIVQNSVQPAEPQALRARAAAAGGAQISVLRVNLRAYERRREEFLRAAIPWHGAGRITLHEHIVEGLANAPAQLLRTLRGETFGRALVRL